jgi:4'-phosphopantetheinyl transferase
MCMDVSGGIAHSLSVADLPTEHSRRTSDGPRKKIIAVWYADLSTAMWQSRRALDVLSEDEHARASRFRFRRDLERFRAAHVALRMVLGACLGGTARSLRFVVNDCGKPRLDIDTGANTLEFNMSHSDHWAAIAVSNGCLVGVDVEQVRDSRELHSLAVQCFAPAEAAYVRGVVPEKRCRAFFRCWTRKEAFIKGCGKGFSVRPDSFDVRPSEPGPVAVSSVEDHDAGWTVVDLPPPPGCASALAIHGEWDEVKCGFLDPAVDAGVIAKVGLETVEQRAG